MATEYLNLFTRVQVDAPSYPGVDVERGKAEREGRKIGHITVTADDRITLDARIRALAAVLPNPMALPKD